MQEDDKLKHEILPEHEVELGKIHASKASLVEHNKVETRESEETDELHDELDSPPDDTFQPVALCFLHRDSPPRRWFIRLVTWPYPL